MNNRAPTIALAVLLTVLLPVLAHWLPTAAVIVAVWALLGVFLLASWCGAVEVVHRRKARRRARQLDQHWADVRRIVE